MSAVIVLMVIIIILQCLLVWMLKGLGDDLIDFQFYSDKQYVDILDSIYQTLEAEDKTYKLLKEWSEKNG